MPLLFLLFDAARKVVLESRVWIDFVFLSGKDAAAFFAEFLTKATDFYAHVSNILCGITSANYSTFSGTLSRQPSPKLRSRTSL